MILLLRIALAGGGGAIAAAAAISLTGSSSATPSVKTVPAQKGAVLATVSATGNIVAAASFSLSLPSGRRITSIAVSTGDTVKAGQVLATADDAEPAAQVALALAQLARANTQLAEDRSGQSSAEARHSAASEAQARVAVTNARKALALAKAGATASNRGAAVATQQAQSQLIGSKKSVAADRTALVAARRDATTRTRALRDAVASTAARASELRGPQQQQVDMQKQQAANSSTVADLQRQVGDAQSAGDQGLYNRSRRLLAAAEAAVLDMDKRLTDVGFAITLAGARLQAQQDAESDARTELSSARAEVDALVTSVAAGHDQVESTSQALQTALSSEAQNRVGNTRSVEQAEAALAASRASLNATVASNRASSQPVSGATVAASRLAVTEAASQVAAARRALAESVLRAPAAGVVTTVGGSVGESSGAISSNGAMSGLITLTQVQGLGIVAGVNETDAARIKPGQPATVSVDALGGQKFAAHVTTVAPTSTVVNNVVTFDVTLALDNPQGKLKPGMTAAIEIVVDQRLNVVNVPTAAVQGAAGGTYVIVLNDAGEQVQVPVTTGLQGDATTQITSGLSAGQPVVLQTVAIDSKKAADGKKAGLAPVVGK